jgi:hypothetical protein
MNILLILLITVVLFVLWGSKEHFYYLRRYDEEVYKLEEERKKCIELTNDYKGCDEDYFMKLRLLDDLKDNTVFYHLYYPGYRNHRYRYYSKPSRYHGIRPKRRSIRR